MGQVFCPQIKEDERPPPPSPYAAKQDIRAQSFTGSDISESADNEVRNFTND